MESDVGKKRCAQLMKISSREVNTEIRQHVEVTPAFSAGNSWRYAEIFSTKHAGSGWRGKGGKAGEAIVSLHKAEAR